MDGSSGQGGCAILVFMNRSFERGVDRRANYAEILYRRDIFPEYPALSDALVRTTMAFLLGAGDDDRLQRQRYIREQFQRFLQRMLPDYAAQTQFLTELSVVMEHRDDFAIVAQQLQDPISYEVEPRWVEYMRHQKFGPQVGRLWLEAGQDLDALASAVLADIHQTSALASTAEGREPEPFFPEVREESARSIWDDGEELSGLREGWRRDSHPPLTSDSLDDDSQRLFGVARNAPEDDGADPYAHIPTDDDDGDPYGDE